MTTITRVESHIFKENKVLDDLCFKSKNLYNSGLYIFKQTLLNENKWLFYSDFIKYFQGTDIYKELPAQVAQQTLKQLDRNIKSYVKTIKDYSKNKSKYKGKPKLPRYLDSKTGRFVYINPGQSISLKNNKIVLLKNVFTIKTKLTTEKINEVRIVPKLGYHKVEVVYQKQIYNNETKIQTRYLGIDVGLGNLMGITNIDTNSSEAVEYDSTSDFSFLVKGTPIKSINQFYNKQLAQIKSTLKTVNNKYWSKKLSLLTLKRNQKIEDYLHKASRTIIDLSLQFQIGTIVIGHNKDWKQKIELGKRNNQNFVSVPLNRLIQMITYKAEEYGIEVKEVEESYTSKVDHLVKEPMKNQEVYLGKRVKRGLFQSSIGRLVNADINGAIGILRKVVGDDFLGSLINRGDVYSPFKLNI